MRIAATWMKNEAPCGRSERMRAMRKPKPVAVLATALLTACASAGPEPEPEPRIDPPAVYTEPVVIPPGNGAITDFLGCRFADGSTRRQSIRRDEMPWRVAIDTPKNNPRYGSRADARRVAIEAMRAWERAIQTRAPWFELEFVDRDPAAPVQIEWKRRVTGSAQGRAGPVCAIGGSDGRSVRAGGEMEVGIQSCPTCTPITLDEIRMLFAHEFGHILGLGHCLDCDSAMNYSWHTRDRVFVTRTDVEAIVQLLDGGEAGPP